MVNPLRLQRLRAMFSKLKSRHVVGGAMMASGVAIGAGTGYSAYRQQRQRRQFQDKITGTAIVARGITTNPQMRELVDKGGVAYARRDYRVPGGKWLGSKGYRKPIVSVYKDGNAYRIDTVKRGKQIERVRRVKK